MFHLRCIAACVFAVFLLAGCGVGGSAVDSKGTLTWEDGTPIAGATIRCVPKDSAVPEALGVSDQKGAFSLSTQKGPGALPGEYTVVITKTVAPAGMSVGEGEQLSPEEMMKLMKKVGVGKTVATKSEVPAVYSDAASSPLKLTITGASDKHELKLKKT